MKKTGQLNIVSKKGENIIDRVNNGKKMYFYYMELTPSLQSNFKIEGEDIEASANKTLTIRTPVSSLVCMKDGVNVKIMYETGDSTSFSCSELSKVIGNGVLSTNSQTIIGAINELSSSPAGGGSSPGGAGIGTKFPNEKTLMKITEDSLNSWDSAYSTSSQNSSSITTINNKLEEMSKKLLEEEKKNSLQDSFFYQVEGAINNIGGMVSQKADKTYVDLINKDLLTKASIEEVDKKASIEELKEIEASKANKTDLDSINIKVEEKFTNENAKILYAEIEKKASISDLDDKADKGQITILNNTKANKEDLIALDLRIDEKADITSLNKEKENIAKNSALIAKVTNELESVNNYFQTGLSSASDRIASNKTSIDSISARVELLEETSILPPLNPEEGFRFPNEQVLLKIADSSLKKWDDYEGKIEDNKVSIEALQGDLTLAKASILQNSNSINEGIKTLEEQMKLIDDLELINNKNSQYLEDIGGFITDINLKLEDKVDYKELLDTRVGIEASLTESINEVDSRLSSELSKKASASKVQELDTSILNKVDKKDFNSLKALVDQKAGKSDIAAVQTGINGNAASILSNTEKISKITMDVSKNVADIEGLVIKLEMLEDAITSSPGSDNSAALSKLTEAFNSVWNNIKNNETNIIGLSEELEKIKADIDKKIAENSTALETISKTVDNSLTSIETLNTSINRINNSIFNINEQISKLTSQTQKDVYIEKTITTKKIVLELEKSVSAIVGDNPLSLYEVEMPFPNKPTQLGFSILIPVDKESSVKFLNTTPIYWESPVPEKLTGGVVYEFVLTYQNRVWTGGYVKYVLN